MQPASTPQLTAYLRLRREGCSIATAAEESGLPVDAAWEAEAAVRLQRNCIGIELNPEYAELARRRIEGDSSLFAQVDAA